MATTITTTPVPTARGTIGFPGYTARMIAEKRSIWLCRPARSSRWFPVLRLPLATRNRAHRPAGVAGRL